MMADGREAEAQIASNIVVAERFVASNYIPSNLSQMVSVSYTGYPSPGPRGLKIARGPTLSTLGSSSNGE